MNTYFGSEPMDQWLIIAIGSEERNRLLIFGRGANEELLCNGILNLGQLFRN